MTDLTFYSAPDVLENAIGGSAGFVLLARIFAATANRIYPEVRKMCCPNEASPLLLRLASVYHHYQVRAMARSVSPEDRYEDTYEAFKRSRLYEEGYGI